MAEEGATENEVDEKGDRLHEALGNQIGRIGFALLKDYINHGFKRKNIGEAPRLEGVDTESQQLSADELQTCKNLGLQLQRMGDQLQDDVLLQRQMDCLPSKPSVETIMTVANVLFGDTKNINWGRIVTLFYFTLEMCVRAYRYFSHDELISWFKDLLTEVALFIVQHFANWIMENGGWNGILTYCSTYPSTVWVTLATVSAISAIYLIYKYNQK